MRKTVLFWHHTLLNKTTGSSEKLLRDLAESLYNSSLFNVILVASATEDPVALSHDNLTIIILTEPELQDLFAILFNERTALEKMIDETKADLDIKPKKAVKKK
jgi:hypothetical protein